MTRIEFSVAGEPVGQPRARHSARLVRGRVMSRVYNPTSVKRKDGTRVAHPIVSWREAIKNAAWQHRPAFPWTGPIALTIEAYFERPQRLLKKNSPDDPVWHTAKPDRDNVEKAVMDVLKEIGFFLEDSQVCGGDGTKKWYVARGYSPGISVVVERLGETSDMGLLQAARAVPLAAGGARE